ncbi:MAG: aminoacyl-tRNA hydrolase [Ktedonobacteraceae bacterium]|nr:aminoacyl-tRNA hydrolase [Ktedonobacteraceae bacterium]
MKLIIGLGNPGSQYERTRHNIGFRTVDKLAARLGWKWERHGRAMTASGMLDGEKIILVKPITFMNNSGEAVSELVRYYKLRPEDVLVIYDELDLPVGRIRLRPRGSAAGHNGVESIIRHLHSSNFPRLRIGIGRPTNHRADTINYVLGIPPLDERIQLEGGEDKAVEAVPLILRQGLDAAMNSINADPEAQRKAEEKRRLQLEKRRQREEQQLQEKPAPPGLSEDQGQE